MRKHRVPLGWPKRDPQHYRFAVPNEVWEYKLRPVEFMLLAYLCYQWAHDRGEKKICVQAVANRLHLSAATVGKHLATLMNKGLVISDCVPTPKCKTGNFFSLPNEAFLLDLPPSVFVVYAYLLCREDRRSHQCHPSCRTISAATGLSLNTVVKAVDILADKKPIVSERTCWFNEQGMKRNGNNHHAATDLQHRKARFVHQLITVAWRYTQRLGHQLGVEEQWQDIIGLVE